jgi:hypothetical protein
VPFRAQETLASSKDAGWASPAHMTFAGDHRVWEWRGISAHPRFGVLRGRGGRERSVRTTAVATLAAAQNGTSGALADSKHAGRRATWATPRTGVLGHPFLWTEAHYRGRAIVGQLQSAIGSTRGFPSSISFNEDKTPDVIGIVGQVQAAGRSDRNEAPWQTTKSGNQSRSEEGRQSPAPMGASPSSGALSVASLESGHGASDHLARRRDRRHS